MLLISAGDRQSTVMSPWIKYRDNQTVSIVINAEPHTETFTCPPEVELIGADSRVLARVRVSCEQDSASGHYRVSNPQPFVIEDADEHTEYRIRIVIVVENNHLDRVEIISGGVSDPCSGPKMEKCTANHGTCQPTGPLRFYCQCDPASARYGESCEFVDFCKLDLSSHLASDKVTELMDRNETVTGNGACHLFQPHSHCSMIGTTETLTNEILSRNDTSFSHIEGSLYYGYQKLTCCDCDEGYYMNSSKRYGIFS